LDAQQDRKALLEDLGKAYNLSFTDKEVKEFSKIGMSGVPIEKMKAFIDSPPEIRDSKESALGIPVDSLNNQFKVWVKTAREVNKNLRLAIKADQGTPYKVIKNVMNTLQDIHENRYNLITKLEQLPNN
jgi:hypothetical protein